MPDANPTFKNLSMPIELDFNYDIGVQRTQHVDFHDQLTSLGGMLAFLLLLKYLALPVCALYFVYHFRLFLIRKSQ